MAHSNIQMKSRHRHKNHKSVALLSTKDCLRERSSIKGTPKTIRAGRTKTECCAPRLMKHWGPLTAWNKHEPWWGTVTLMVFQRCAFQKTVSDQLWRASGVFWRPPNHRPKIQIWLSSFHLHLLFPRPFYSLMPSLHLFFILHHSCSSFQMPLIAYHRCSWQVCRHRSSQSAWWGSCTGQWSAQRSLPPLLAWTRSWQQIPGSAGLGV